MRVRSNPLALAVLACLYEKPMHPYEVAQTLRERAKHDSVRLNYGSLYSVVESLERRRLIAAQETVREGRRPERTVYAITDAGAREFVDWLSELVAEPVKEYPQFEAALSFIVALPPDDALELLQTRVNKLEVAITQFNAALQRVQEFGLPRVFELEGEYHVRLVQAELDWARSLIKDIEAGSLDGLDLWRGFHDGTLPPGFKWTPQQPD
jgi:DNA-binding PadR family transcriptional regulator